MFWNAARLLLGTRAHRDIARNWNPVLYIIVRPTISVASK